MLMTSKATTQWESKRLVRYVMSTSLSVGWDAPPERNTCLTNEATPDISAMNATQCNENQTKRPDGSGRVLIVACGALAREVAALRAVNGLDHVDLTCLPAMLHNRPERIPAAIEQAIESAKGRHDRILVAYGDCGTGGGIDAVCDRHGARRIAGPHCYAFYSGLAAFEARGDEDMDVFFLTDFLARQFEAIVIRPLGLDRHPELRDAYFGQYRRLAYLAQTDDRELDRRARAAAGKLGLAYERRLTGFGDLASFIASAEIGRPA